MGCGEMEVKYPNIEVQLTGNDGNAFAIIGSVRRALVQEKVDSSEVTKFLEEAMSGDYDHLLQTCMKWVVVK